jgi:D-alanine-D-alanine ligase-like ATP-grasp enzyme
MTDQIKITGIVPESFDTEKLFWIKNIKYIFIKNNDTSKEAICKIRNCLRETDIYLNLYDKSNDTGQKIVDYLYENNYPYTGVDNIMYDPSREILKMICRYNDIETPNYCFIYDIMDIKNKKVEEKVRELKFPLFVKPELGYDSVGIDEKSKVNNLDELNCQLEKIIDRFGGALVEEYCEGRELSVLISGTYLEPENIILFDPVEYVFKNKDINYLTENIKATETVDYWYEKCTDNEIIDKIKEIGKKIFIGFECTGYIRIDMKMMNNCIKVLDVNPYCSLFMNVDENKCSTADKILKVNNWSYDKFLDHIIEIGFKRYKRKERKFYINYIDRVKKFGMFAKEDISKGNKIYSYEMEPHVLISRNEIDRNKYYKEQFDAYKYPVSRNIFVAWDKNPKEWKPINHSCDPNSCVKDLNLYAFNDIKKDDEITIDYSTFIDIELGFDCYCGSEKCRKKIILCHDEEWFKEKYGNNISDYMKIIQK